MRRADRLLCSHWLALLLILRTASTIGPDYAANFSAYLRRWHHQELSQTETWWVVIPENGCQSCQQRAVELAAPLLARTCGC